MPRIRGSAVKRTMIGFDLLSRADRDDHCEWPSGVCCSCDLVCIARQSCSVRGDLQQLQSERQRAEFESSLSRARVATRLQRVFRGDEAVALFRPRRNSSKFVLATTSVPVRAHCDCSYSARAARATSLIDGFSSLSLSLRRTSAGRCSRSTFRRRAGGAVLYTTTTGHKPWVGHTEVSIFEP